MKENPLGRPTKYVGDYNPDILFAISRSEKRAEIQVEDFLFGEDIWNAFELSWLNPNGLPQVAIGEFRLPCNSPNIIESKSLKLYLNSFNETRFDSIEQVTRIITNDLSALAGQAVKCQLFQFENADAVRVRQLEGQCIDQQAIKIDHYDYQPQFLSADASNIVEQTLVSHLLKSNCLITHQPDWASIQIKYRGPAICTEGLLRYIVSFRHHNEFHEQCVERIYGDIKRICGPQRLTVYARYTRRGGLDINPWRSDFEHTMENVRLSRQ